MGFIKGKEDRNQTFTAAGRVAGNKLQEMFDANATEAAIAKAGFGADSQGRWFAKVGERQVRLDSDCALGRATEVVSVPEIVAVPIPLQVRVSSLPGRGLATADAL